MKFWLAVFFLAVTLTTTVSAQETNRDQKLAKISEMNAQIKLLENNFLLPEAEDFKEAERQNLKIFRLMPRETYDRKFTVQGGGSYYSFTTKSHDYQKTAQIGLERGFLKVGFAGADYGFIGDLGEVSLADVTKETVGVNFLADYRPPTNEPEVRSEQRKSHSYQTEMMAFQNRLTAKIGHSYVLRAISFGEADVLVALKIHRKDADGSLIIFWKMLEEFEKPLLARK